jgi:hypothetical protein
MLGPVAITYGVFTFFAALVAYCGPSRAAQLVSLFAVASWVVCNVAFKSLPTDQAVVAFELVDFFGSSLGIIIFLLRPRVWSFLFAISITLQSLMHFAYYSHGVELHYRYLYLSVLNGLLIPQLIAITVPTCSSLFERGREIAMSR